MALLFGIVFALSCENNELQAPKELDKAALKSVLDKNETYQELVKVLVGNYSALSLMTETERTKFLDLGEKSITLDNDAITEFGRMCDEFGFSSKNYKLSKTLEKELRHKYSFDRKNYNEILKEDYGKGIERLLANGRILVAAPYPYCIFFCEDLYQGEADAMKADMPWDEDSGMSYADYEFWIDRVVAALISGCYRCCSIGQPCNGPQQN